MGVPGSGMLKGLVKIDTQAKQDKIEFLQNNEGELVQFMHFGEGRTAIVIDYNEATERVHLHCANTNETKWFKISEVKCYQKPEIN